MSCSMEDSASNGERLAKKASGITKRCMWYVHKNETKHFCGHVKMNTLLESTHRILCMYEIILTPGLTVPWRGFGEGI